MGCKDCLYRGLTGIVVNENPGLDFLRHISSDEVSFAAKYFGRYKYDFEPGGIATTFWGHDTDYLLESMIVDIESNEAYKAQFNIEEGVYTPDHKVPDCTASLATESQLDKVMRGRAMKELLSQALSYLNGHEREGNYFMITPYSRGCCGFGGGKINIELGHLMEIIEEYRKNKKNDVLFNHDY